MKGAIDAEMTVNVKMPDEDPVVFVSHQRSELAEAERMADLACRRGIDYWLDIHDPVLVLANPDGIAAGSEISIIEMGPLDRRRPMRIRM